MTQPYISVVICAYTEARFEQTLAAAESVRAQSLPSHETVIVVDHNPVLYAQLETALPDVTVVHSQHDPGLSGGRNTGVAVARGEIIAFLDDDAIADPDWLKFLVDPYQDEAVVGVGGLILPEWASQRPSWFPEEFDWVVGCTYRGIPRARVTVRNMLGANMSFRREVFELSGGFRNGIGRIAGKRPLGCEETEFCIRVRQRWPGSVMLFEGRAIVRHSVPSSRCTFAYFRSRCFAEGISKALVTANVGSSDGLSTERRYITRTLPDGMAKGVRELFRGNTWGLARCGAIAIGLAVTALGYILGKLRGKAEGSLSDQPEPHVPWSAA